jgi:cell division septation protein DedD
MTLDRSDGTATIDLYRAALGPLRTDYYLKTFTRFDSVGKTGPSWNWAAALLSLNWMLFRKLWTVALSYVGTVMATTLLLFGIGRLVFQLSQETQWALLLLGVLLTIALPGAYGNAWLYAACNRKMERALAASATLEEASTLLTREAAGTKRIVSLASINVAVCLILGAMVLSWPTHGALPHPNGPVSQAHAAGLVQSGLATQTLSAATTAPAPTVTASTPLAIASLAASALQPASSAVVASAASAQRSTQGVVQEVATVQPAPETERAQPTPALNAEKAAQPAKTTKVAKPTKAERLAKAKAAKLAAKAAARVAAKESTMEAAKSRANKADIAARAAAVASSAPESGKYLINVGLFADANNARNAYVKLKDAGLPALSQEVKSSKGTRTRVRVGPFESQPEADSAAERIRVLQLDAAVFKQ